MKTVTRLIPCPPYDVEGMESWLFDMAAKGYILTQDGIFAGFATFECADPRHIRYRLEPAPKARGIMSDYNDPSPEAQELAAAYNWEYIAARGDFFIYRTFDPGAREMNTDPRVLALALNAVRKRRRDSVFTEIFWFIIYPALYSRIGLFTFMIELSSFLAGAIFLVCLLHLIVTFLHFLSLNRLYRRLKSMQFPDHHRSWQSHAYRYFICRTALAVFTVAVVIICAVRFSDHTMDKDKIPLSDLDAPPPFATMEVIAGDTVSYREDYFGIPNDTRHWSDPLAPDAWDWREHAVVTRSDGSVFEGGLYVTYYRTPAPWIARAVAWEWNLFLHTDQWRLFSNGLYQEIPLPSLLCDYIVAGNSHSVLTDIVFCKGCVVCKASFYQTGKPENRLTVEEIAKRIVEFVE